MKKFAIARNRGRACLHEELFMLKTIINYGLRLVYLIFLLDAIATVDFLTATNNNIKPLEARISHLQNTSSSRTVNALFQGKEALTFSLNETHLIQTLC